MTRNGQRQRPAHNQFAETLRRLQGERGMTNEEAARELGVGLRLYQMWRAGQRPGTENLIRLARFFDVTVDELIGGPVKDAA